MKNTWQYLETYGNSDLNYLRRLLTPTPVKPTKERAASYCMYCGDRMNPFIKDKLCSPDCVIDFYQEEERLDKKYRLFNTHISMYRRLKRKPSYLHKAEIQLKYDKKIEELLVERERVRDELKKHRELIKEIEPTDG